MGRLLFGVLILSLSGMTWSAEGYYNFNGNQASGWTNVDGTWSISSEQKLVQASTSSPKAYISNNSYSDLIMDADVTFRSDMTSYREGGIFFRANNIAAGTDNYQGYYAFLTGGDSDVRMKINGLPIQCR